MYISENFSPADAVPALVNTLVPKIPSVRPGSYVC